MDVRVLGWRYQNIRGGLRDVEIDLGGPPARWALIQMPNGTGKTTTMSLLRAVFTGELFSSEAVRDLRASDDCETGLFELRLTIQDRPYRLQLRLDFRAGTASYWTARSELRSGGLEEGLLLPNELKRLLSADFTRLFVFDGELAKEIRAVGKDRASAAIRTLYRLDRLAELKQQVARLVDETQQKAAAVSTAVELKGVRRWRNLAASLEAKKAELTQAVRDKQKRRKELEARKKQLAGQVEEHIQQDDSLRDRKEALDAERREIDRDIHDATAEGLALLRTPARLHPRLLTRLHALGGKLTQLKLPKTISAEFFHELAEQPECICGRPVSLVERTAILERASLYLAEDQIAVINKMKLALRESAGDDSAFATMAAKLREALRNLQRNKTAHDQLELDRIEAGDTELEQLRNQLSGVESELRRIDVELERLTTKDPRRQSDLLTDEKTNLPRCEAELKRCQEKLATITHTRRFTLQGERVQELLDQIAADALDRLRERVRLATNDKLVQLVPAEALRVSRIGGALELQSPRLSSKTGVSEGQSLAVAYAFLTSLLTDAPYRLPFIVDSPAVSLDTRVRREVGELIPGLFGQMIMFVISSEREGFADAFYDREGVKFVTLWRETDEITEAREGLPFFRTFHALEAAE